MALLRILALICLTAVTAGAEVEPTGLNVLATSEARREAGSMFIQYQKANALASLAHRDAEVAAIKSRKEVFTRARNAREALIRSVGGLPSAKHPLAAHTVGVIERGDFMIEKVLYQSRPDFWVSANLYMPGRLDGKTAPAVLTPMGHSSEGKGARWLQERAIGLVRLGYIVLAYDQVGLGERWQYWDPKTKLSRIGHRKDTGEFYPNSMRTTLEHFHAGNQAWLTGDSLAQHVVWDAVRGIDYLLTRPEVDPDRIACSGASMGGLATMVLTAVEPRLKVSVPVSHVSKRRYLLEKEMARDAEQIFPGCYTQGWDHGDLLLPMVLQRGHLQICANTGDFFPIKGSRETARELGRLFRIAGLGEHFRFTESKHGHGWSKETYENLYAFLGDAFNRPRANPQHTVTRADTLIPDELRCTEAGQVTASPLKSKTVFDFSRERTGVLRNRRRANRSPRAIVEAARRRIAVTSMPDNVEGSQVGTSPWKGIIIEKWLIDSESGIQLPALLMRHQDAHSSSPLRVVIHASPRGKQSVFKKDRFPLEEILDGGALVLAIDLRGWGEMRWRREPDKSISSWRKYTASVSGEESIFTYNSLRNGRTMVGHWALDLLAAASWIRDRPEFGKAPGPDITFWGENRLGVAALHALALSNHVNTDAVIQDTLYSYDDWGRTRYYDVPVSLVIPGILRDYDLAELSWAASTLRGRHSVIWLNPVDAKGLPIDADTAARPLGEVATAFGGGKAKDIARILVFDGDPDWSKLRSLQSDSTGSEEGAEHEKENP